MFGHKRLASYRDPEQTAGSSLFWVSIVAINAALFGVSWDMQIKNLIKCKKNYLSGGVS